MQRSYYLPIAIVLAAVVVIGLFLWEHQRAADSAAVYDTAEDALAAGISEHLSVTKTASSPIFSWQAGDGTCYYVLPYTIHEDGNLSYAEAVYYLKVFPSGSGYSYEASASNVAIYQEDEDGNVADDSFVATLTDPPRGITMLVGKSEKKTVIPSERDLLETNLTGGIADNSWGIFVLVYQPGQTPPDMPQVISADEAAAPA